MFRFIRGILTVILRVTDEWTEILDEGGCIDVIYMGFKKTFDTDDTTIFREVASRNDQDWLQQDLN